MRITNISIPYYNKGSFMVAVGDPEIMIQVEMTKEESARVRSVVTEMFLSRQAAIAKDIREAQPIMLADFSEVASPPVQAAPHIDDDIPF